MLWLLTTEAFCQDYSMRIRNRATLLAQGQLYNPRHQLKEESKAPDIWGRHCCLTALGIAVGLLPAPKAPSFLTVFPAPFPLAEVYDLYCLASFFTLSKFYFVLMEERHFRISLGDIEEDFMPTAEHEGQGSHRQIGTSWITHREGSSVPLPNKNRY